MPADWKQSGLRWYWIVGLVILADQLSKQIILATFKLNESLNLLPFFSLTYRQNTGAAFSFLHDAGGWQRWLFALVAIGFSVVLTVWLRRQHWTEKLSAVAFTLVIGGAVGNLIDRLMHGFVVDFLHFFYQDYHYPAFNIADSAICVGAVLIIFEGFFVKKPHENKSNG